MEKRNNDGNDERWHSRNVNKIVVLEFWLFWSHSASKVFIKTKIAGKIMNVKVANISDKDVTVEVASGMQFTIAKDKLF